MHLWVFIQPLTFLISLIGSIIYSADEVILLLWVMYADWDLFVFCIFFYSAFYFVIVLYFFVYIYKRMVPIYCISGSMFWWQNTWTPLDWSECRWSYSGLCCRFKVPETKNKTHLYLQTDDPFRYINEFSSLARFWGALSS